MEDDFKQRLFERFSPIISRANSPNIEERMGAIRDAFDSDPLALSILELIVEESKYEDVAAEIAKLSKYWDTTYQLHFSTGEEMMTVDPFENLLIAAIWNLGEDSQEALIEIAKESKNFEISSLAVERIDESNQEALIDIAKLGNPASPFAIHKIYKDNHEALLDIVESLEMPTFIALNKDYELNDKIKKEWSKEIWLQQLELSKELDNCIYTIGPAVKSLYPEELVRYDQLLSALSTKVSCYQEDICQKREEMLFFEDYDYD